jgi:hypothetical protein
VRQLHSQIILALMHFCVVICIFALDVYPKYVVRIVQVVIREFVLVITFSVGCNRLLRPAGSPAGGCWCCCLCNFSGRLLGCCLGRFSGLFLDRFRAFRLVRGSKEIGGGRFFEFGFWGGFAFRLLGWRLLLCSLLRSACDQLDATQFSGSRDAYFASSSSSSSESTMTRLARPDFLGAAFFAGVFWPMLVKVPGQDSLNELAADIPLLSFAGWPWAGHHQRSCECRQAS